MSTSSEERSNDGEYSSKIRVIYNPNFIDFIKKLRQDNDLSGLRFNTLEIVLPTQQVLRDYIVKNQHLFDLQYGEMHFGSECHPDFFAIMICIIVPNLEEYSNFNEILEISRVGLWSISLYSSENDDLDYAGTYFRCACHHTCSPENLFIISNLQSEKNILIGCCCAQKYSFIEPEDVKRVKKERESEPIYKKATKYTRIKNELRHKEKICQEVKKLGETEESIRDNYIYYGGNSGLHLEYFNQKSSGLDINEVCDVDKCDTCNQKITNMIVLCNESNDDCLRICQRCCDNFGKTQKKSQGICDDCGAEHRNRSDNYCNKCREKIFCIKCVKRAFCDQNEHCKDCVEKYIFCINCKINTTTKQGYRCYECFTKTKKCSCGAPIWNEKWSQCYNCNKLR